VASSQFTKKTQKIGAPLANCSAIGWSPTTDQWPLATGHGTSITWIFLTVGLAFGGVIAKLFRTFCRAGSDRKVGGFLRGHVRPMRGP